MTPIEIIALIPTSILFLIVVSQYILMALPKKSHSTNYNPKVSVVIPAYNEEKNIENTVKSIVKTKYSNEREIIFIDDGSEDSTYKILKTLEKKYPIVAYTKRHAGKSAAVNFGIRKAKHDVIIICDADSEPKEDAIEQVVKPLADKSVAAVAGIVRVKNKNTLLSSFQSLEYAYFSFYNHLLWKVNGVIFTPGVLSAYKKDILMNLGLFPENSSTEDFKIALRIHKNGYKIATADKAVSYTNVPITFKRLFKQRLRWARGILTTIKEPEHRNLHLSNKMVGLYSVPVLAYWYIHALLMIPIILYLSVSGYIKWILPYSSILSVKTAEYFFYWFSFFGILNLVKNIYLGFILLNPLLAVSIIVTLMTYPMYLYSVYRYDRKIGFKEFLVLPFFFPYTMFIATTQITAFLYSFTTKKIKW